ncbi:MAG: methyltransferase type 11 [SAR202 cluster bacterium MP-SAtl-SRR3965592-G2]|nr:MAG: methyltransferase type 11 [SAR202 cluster bacterium MP-SAtl-SRR3965592-G2]
MSYPEESFQREDDSDDRLFYVNPRLVVHIDDQAIATVSRIFQSFLPEDSTVLDLMSSWRSHWPQGHPKEKLVGLGLNAQEMADNPDLDEFVVHDVNLEPALPFEDESFDGVVITVSAQYLTSPVETFREVNRILKPGGVFIVTFSNRMFPTKAVRIWRMASDQGRMDIVISYMESAGGFEEIRSGFVNSDESPPDDPIFSVVSNKSGGPE